MKLFWSVCTALCFAGIVALAFFWSNGNLDGQNYWAVFWSLFIGMMYSGARSE